MSLPLIIYLASVSDNLSSLLTLIATISGVGSLLLLMVFIFCFIDDDNDCKIFKNLIIKLSLPIFLASSSLTVILPSEKTIYMMIGADTAKNLYTSETGQKVMKLVNQKIDEELDKSLKAK